MDFVLFLHVQDDDEILHGAAGSLPSSQENQDLQLGAQEDVVVEESEEEEANPSSRGEEEDELADSVYESAEEGVSEAE